MDIGKAIAKWFNFYRILANTTQGPYYHNMISSIQKTDTGTNTERDTQYLFR